MYSERVTVIIPTYNRSDYCKRALNYWCEQSVCVIVVDGSAIQSIKLMPENVNYLFLPECDLRQRIVRALAEVDTPYTVLCADDDFIGIRGIGVSIDFLENNSDYVSAQGRYIFFDIKSLHWHVEYKASDYYQVSSDDVMERAIQAMNPYMHQSYAVTRTDVMKQCYDNDLEHFNAMEINVVLMSAIAGKHRVLPTFYGARQVAVISPSLENRDDIFAWMRNSDQLHHVSDWKKMIAASYAEATGRNIRDGDVFFDIVLEQYRLFCSTKRPKSVRCFFRKMVKNMLPQWAAKCYQKKFSPLYRFDDDSKVLTRYSPTDEYPLADQMALDDWHAIRKVILNKEYISSLAA